MKRYAKEIAALVLQAALFYLFPLCAGPTDAMGMVVLMLLATFALGLLLGALSDNPIKWACPAAAAAVTAPAAVWATIAEPTAPSTTAAALPAIAPPAAATVRDNQHIHCALFY